MNSQQERRMIILFFFNSMGRNPNDARQNYCIDEIDGMWQLYVGQKILY